MIDSMKLNERIVNIIYADGATTVNLGMFNRAEASELLNVLRNDVDNLEELVEEMTLHEKEET
jgi:hypothetical protein